MTAAFDSALADWLEAVAPSLDDGSANPSLVLRRLAEAGMFTVGVPRTEGGDGGTVADAIEAIAAVSQHSMAAGFLFWSQRTFIEYLIQSPNTALRRAILPDLLSGRTAGATGLSNAMKFLSGIEDLQINARPDDSGWRADGLLPWVTNLIPSGFYVAAAIARPDGPPFVAALPYSLPGLIRSPDLDLMGMRATATASIRLQDVAIRPTDLLHDNALQWLPNVRPAFLGLQCGMAIGLTRRALTEAARHVGPARHVLKPERERLQASLDAAVQDLRQGILHGRFHAHAKDLFRLRIAIAGLAFAATHLELRATGGRAYLRPHGDGFARRWREAAFVPVITPSLTQLEAMLVSEEPQQEQAA